MEGNNSSGSGLGLILAIDKKGIVRFGLEAEVCNAVFPEVVRKAVTIAAQVADKSFAPAIENKGSEIEMGVIGFVVPALEPYPK